MGRILVVEDDPAMTEGIRDILELADHNVMTASNGAAALERMADATPDLILSDIKMPGMDGFDFYERVRANPMWLFTPFVFLTALGQTDAVCRGKRMGADDYLVKPVDPQHLLATVDSKLNRSRAMSSAAAKGLKRFTHRVTGVLGHEIRTPVSWIKAYSEILLEDPEDLPEEQLRSALQAIKEGSDRLSDLVDTAVLLVRLNSGQADEEFRMSARAVSDLPRRIREAVERFEPLADARGVALEVALPATLPEVTIVPRFLDAMIAQLVVNGIKFSRGEEQSFVRVTAGADADGVTLSVVDNGLGVPPEARSRIFEPYVQIDRERQEQQGVGLGLAVARGLAEIHGGTITVHDREGHGSVFRLQLPTEVPEPDGRVHAAAAPQRERSSVALWR